MVRGFAGEITDPAVGYFFPRFALGVHCFVTVMDGFIEISILSRRSTLILKIPIQNEAFFRIRRILSPRRHLAPETTVFASSIVIVKRGAFIRVTDKL